VLYKNAIYSFHFPVVLVLLFCSFPVEGNRSDPGHFNLAFDMPSPLGGYFQIQDDYLDFSWSLSYSGRSRPTWITSVRGGSTRP